MAKTVIRKLREAAGLTAEEVAAEAGIGVSTLYHHETGVRALSTGREAEVVAAIERLRRERAEQYDAALQEWRGGCGR